MPASAGMRRKQIVAGLDPAQEKKRARVAAKIAAANTFKDVAEEWVAKCEREGRATVTMEKIRWLLGMAYPAPWFSDATF